MANPFKMAEQAKKKAPGSKQEHEVKEVKEEVVVTEEVQEKVPVVQEAPVAEEAPVEQVEVKVEEKPEEKTAEKPAPKREKKPEKAEKPALDIFAKLETEKPSGKTYAFYLSDDNVAKLKKMAEKNKISASKLLDHILSEVL